MASDPEFVKFVCNQIGAAGEIASRKMFGEYAVYCNGKVVALVCDDCLFVKPTNAARAFVGVVAEAAPYPGAKPHWVIEDRLDDREWVTELVRLTERALPAPRPRKML